MKKESIVKIESFLVASTAASVSFLIAFLRSWGIPLSSAIKAIKASKQDKYNFFGICEIEYNFFDVYHIEYVNSVYKMAQIPLSTYNKYKGMVCMCHRKYER